MGVRWYQETSRGQWLALAAALLGWMFDGFEQGIFPLVGRPALIGVLGLSEDNQAAARETDPEVRRAIKAQIDAKVGPWLTGTSAAFLVGAALGGWFFGWLGDRIGRVRSMALTVLAYSLFTGLCGFAQDAPQLILLRFLAALGMGGEWALGVALVMESWAPHTRPLLAGFIGAAANVGFLLTPVPVELLDLTGLSLEEGGWRWVLGACALPAALTFLLRMFVPESEKWRHAIQTGPRPRMIDIFSRSLRWRSLLGAVLSAVAIMGTWGAVQYIPAWVQNMTSNQGLANWAQRCSACGAIVGTICAALLGQALGRRRTYFLLCLGSLLVCQYVFRWHFELFPAEGPEAVGVGFLAVVVLVGGMTASFFGWFPLYLPELFPTRVRATGQGFSYNFGRILASPGALSAGILMNRVYEGSYSQACATISLVYIIGLGLIWLAPETRGQPLPE